MSTPHPPPSNPTPHPRPKALLFDFMGTCLDWHTSITSGFSSIDSSSPICDEAASDIAMAWRLGYFAARRARSDAGLAVEDIDVTHRRVLDRVLLDRGYGFGSWGEEARREMVGRWHVQEAWPDVAPALERLRDKFDLVVHANGTTRLQIDLVKSSGLNFNAVLSSELLEVAKPEPGMYEKGMRLLKLKPEECMTVAAHYYDVVGAKNVGMQTAYIRRDTEDPEEDMEEVEREIDYFFDGRGGGVEVGLNKLADFLLGMED